MNWRWYIVFFLFSTKLSAQAPDFEASGVVYFQDSDFNADTHVTQKITKTGVDLMGVFTFPLRYRESQSPSEQSISNSAVENHRMVAFRSDRKVAYVLETRGPLPKGSQGVRLSDLPGGGYVTVVRTNDLHALKLDYRFSVAENPTSITLAPTDKYLAVSSANSGNEIQIFELDDQGKPVRLLPQVLHLDGGAVHDLIWHPSQEYIVFIRREDKEMGLIRVVWDKHHIIRLEQIGETVKFEGSPFSGLFSKDGKTLFILDQGDAANRIAGKVFQVRLSLEEDNRHVLLSKVDVGFNPVNIAMSPSGDVLMVSNRGWDESASISMLSFSNGNLEARSELPLEGAFPTGVVFDKNGKNFAVGCFQLRTFGKPMGNVCFYRFSAGTAEKQPGSILVSAGLHYLQAVY